MMARVNIKLLKGTMWKVRIYRKLFERDVEQWTNIMKDWETVDYNDCYCGHDNVKVIRVLYYISA